MNDWPSVTRLFLVFLVAIIVIYDYIAIRYGGPDASISSAIVKLSEFNPVLPFIGGFVAAHLWWRN